MELLTIEKIDVDCNGLKTVFEENRKAEKVTMGTVVIPPNQRVPLKGLSNHMEHEYSFIIRGSVLVESGGKSHRVTAGQATYIPSGEEHWAINDSPDECEIIYVLVK
ncbi:cupin domain-containing protein [Gottfriedia sp. NPDC057991]|uniref:cupin domain-containing protein n=1 Tax=Gottfriedia sp. NPDC057991 TaxID=3346298 RepID=UPI0036DC9B05